MIESKKHWSIWLAKKRCREVQRHSVFDVKYEVKISRGILGDTQSEPNNKKLGI